MNLAKREPTAQEKHEAYVRVMWLMFLRASATPTAPGEPVDLGEIGEDRSSRGVDRATPYSPGKIR